MYYSISTLFISNYYLFIISINLIMNAVIGHSYPTGAIINYTNLYVEDRQRRERNSALQDLHIGSYLFIYSVLILMFTD